MAVIPGITKTPIYQKKWFAEVLAIPPVLMTGVPVFLTGIPILINYAAPENQGKLLLNVLAITGIIWLVILGVVKALQGAKQDKVETLKQDYDGLRSALHVLHEIITRLKCFEHSELDTGRLRVTIHRVVPPNKPNQDSEELEQLISYIGGSGGDVGRRFSIRSGIIGKAVREGQPFAASRETDSYEDYVRELVSYWSYTPAAARALQEDRMSWMAVPIFYKNKDVEAVVFLDSSEQEFFDLEVQTLVINACYGIASYIRERYK